MLILFRLLLIFCDSLHPGIYPFSGICCMLAVKQDAICIDFSLLNVPSLRDFNVFSWIWVSKYLLFERCNWCVSLCEEFIVLGDHFKLTESLYNGFLRYWGRKIQQKSFIVNIQEQHCAWSFVKLDPFFPIRVFFHIFQGLKMFLNLHWRKNWVWIVK